MRIKTVSVVLNLVSTKQDMREADKEVQPNKDLIGTKNAVSKTDIKKN